ncbi:MAG: hypothetical protein K1X83_08165 [Oligoflexia bacterium]|nr:hypothetical protein [Oligoflexia bacterium]
MSHVALNINIEEVLEAGPIKSSSTVSKLGWAGILIGFCGFFGAMFSGYPLELLWGAYFTNVVFWMGLAAGGVIVCVAVQIVRAAWSPPIRRIAEANVAFLPWAWLALLGTWWGREYLFYWGKHPMPGREGWMQPWFVYLRFGALFLFLFFMMWRYVSMSLRSDIGMLRERNSSRSRWSSWIHQYLAREWKGSDAEVLNLQRRLSWNAPLLLLIYVVVFSLFSFEMVMGMDPVWYSNLFGAFEFCGNLYIAWAMTAVLTIYFVNRSPEYARTVSTQQLWDLGKLTFGFCMLWGYMFFSQFLPQWYGNLPEETQWLILRTREFPWKGLGWITFAMCFIVPFIVLLSEDVKRAPKALRLICIVILLGVWLERYMVIMPELSPGRIPLRLNEILVEISIYLGFLGAYLLSIQSFITKFPFVPVSHPMTRGSKSW